MSQPVPSSEPPLCKICQISPLPESHQHFALSILQLLLLLVSFKISLALLVIGFMFCQTVWVCPLCKRELDNQQESQCPSQEHIVLRFSDCMFLFQKGKFRIIGGFVIAILTYWWAMQQKHQYKPRVQIHKSWKSIVTNCGYDAYLENSFKFNYFYTQYQESGVWELEGIFLAKDEPGKIGLVKTKIKMNPTQFKDQNTHDIQVLIMEPKFQLERGDIVKFKGEWAGHTEQVLTFVADSMQNTGKKVKDFGKQVQVLTHGMLRTHY